MFCINKLKDDKRDAFINLETQYAVHFMNNPQILKHLKKQVGNEYGDPRVDAIDQIEKSIDAELLPVLDRSVRGNTEWEKSKFTKRERSKITVETLVAFNYYLQMALHQYEMCDHLYDRNMINAHYYQNIQKSINEDNRIRHSEFNDFQDKDVLFRVAPGLGIFRN